MHIFPPFEPDDVRRGTPGRIRLRDIHLRKIVPNLVTVLALASGLTAFRMALENRLELAVAAILFAALLDGIDGRVARMMKMSSRFGAEMDSLADFFNFGVAPPMILYVWTLEQLKTVGWVAVILFVVCMALRLARFNVALGGPARQAWRARFCVGVPAPAGALAVLLPVYLHLSGVPYVEDAPIVSVVYVALVALLTISQFPTFSGKRPGGRIHRDTVVPLIFLVLALSIVFISAPWPTLALGITAYLASIPISVRAYRRARALSEEAAATEPEANHLP